MFECMVSQPCLSDEKICLHVLIFLEIVVQLLSRSKVREKDTKAQIQVSFLSGSLVYSIVCGSVEEGTTSSSTASSFPDIFFIASCAVFKWNVKPFDSGSFLFNLFYLRYLLVGCFSSSSFSFPDAWRSWNSIFRLFLFSLSAYFNVIQLTWLGFFTLSLHSSHLIPV